MRSPQPWGCSVTAGPVLAPEPVAILALGAELLGDPRVAFGRRRLHH
jgi:hypothetical protein